MPGTRTVANYREALRKLLPPGILWPTRLESNFVQLLEALGAEGYQVDVRACVLVDEALPNTTNELLPDWEAFAGLPDPCVGGEPGSTSARRVALVARLSNQGGQSVAYFLEVAASLGFDVNVEIEEFRPFQVGRSAAGDPLSNGDWIFVWVVHGPFSQGQPFRVGQNAVGDPLVTRGNEVLECSIERISPAHTGVFFSYDLGLVTPDPIVVSCVIPPVTVVLS